MANATDSLLYKYFKIRYSTWSFVLLSILSCGLYAYFWFIQLLLKFDKEDIRSSIFLIFAVIAIPEWLDFFDLFFNFSVKQYNRIIFWCLIAIPYISYCYRNEFKDFVNRDDISVNINTMYLTVFPIVYQYYILRNTYVRGIHSVSEMQTTNISVSNSETNKQNKNIDREEIKTKIIKLTNLYKSGKITKEKYDMYIVYLKRQWK